MTINLERSNNNLPVQDVHPRREHRVSIWDLHPEYSPSAAGRYASNTQPDVRTLRVLNRTSGPQGAPAEAIRESPPSEEEAPASLSNIGNYLLGSIFGTGLGIAILLGGFMANDEPAPATGVAVGVEQSVVR